ncbi:MAG: hypothetical protein IKB34_03580, partial [Clostridia bacterium]|nr:hypothetical protein [Clostridia bacterium]
MTSFDICKKQWRKMLVGTPDEIKNGDATTRSRIAFCNRAAIKTWKDYKCKGESERVGFFRNTPAEKSNDMTQEYKALRLMALGYATYGTECYQSPELLADILGALEWGYTHYYGVAEIEGRGWRSTKEFNWWDWQIGSATFLMDTIVLVDE